MKIRLYTLLLQHRGIYDAPSVNIYTEPEIRERDIRNFAQDVYVEEATTKPLDDIVAELQESDHTVVLGEQSITIGVSTEGDAH